MIKSSIKNVIDRPDSSDDGYCFDENRKFLIEYFPGIPYPVDIESLIDDDDDENCNSSEDVDDQLHCDLSSSDEEYDEDVDDVNWC